METAIDFFIWPILVSQMFHMPVLVAGFPVGVIGAIALPSFLNQASKAKEAEGKQNISSVNRSQAAYRIEKSTFANTFDQLALGTLKGGSRDETKNYTYQIVVSELDRTVTTATPKNSALKSYTGATFRLDRANQSSFAYILCETPQPSPTPPAIPQIVGTSPVCPPGSLEVK
ncbi:MAG: type IV pilin-like G/H family protein [Cyanosarcina radialis HA8281-LM2]|jgi:type II secretory pathway pseudopilin PulG|nr:type IV pilin-like G/H family protein [Cyanosarcina radialis HA8281-LM2]